MFSTRPKSPIGYLLLAGCVAFASCNGGPANDVGDGNVDDGTVGDSNIAESTDTEASPQPSETSAVPESNSAPSAMPSTSSPPQMNGAGATEGAAEAYLDFIDRLSAFYCQSLFECRIPNDDLHIARARLETEARCVGYITELQRRAPSFADTLVQLENGTIRFDDEVAAACLDEAAPCEASTACAGVLFGHTAIGDTCWRHEMCAPNAFCNSDSGECPGACAERKAPGSGCEHDAECQGEAGQLARCNYAEDPPTCRQHELVNHAELGAQCGTTSDQYISCTTALACDADYGEVGTCVEPTPIGQPCTRADDPCAGAALCLGDDTRVCTAVRVAHQPGEDCSDDLQGAGTITLCDPLANLACVDGSCELVGDGSLGSPCLPHDQGELSCDPGMYCTRDTDPPSCVEYEAPGSECSGSPECVTSCNFDTRRCEEQYCGL